MRYQSLAKGYNWCSQESGVNEVELLTCKRKIHHLMFVTNYDKMVLYWMLKMNYYNSLFYLINDWKQKH